MTIDIGHFALFLSLILVSYAFVAGCAGAYSKNIKLVLSASNSLKCSSALTLFSLLYLGYLFITHDYRYLYVWQTSNNEMSVPYLFAAIWGGMDGSMLLWACILGGYSALAVRNAVEDMQSRCESLFAWATPIISSANLFFLGVVCFLTNPFRTIPNGAALLDGNGLNPVLQNPLMVIHPPCLYLGFTGFAIPASFCLAALMSGDLSLRWVELTRRATLIAWGFLTAGIILGGHWAYVELGWGGFWAWDPVENSSFLPWLFATAFLHSVMVQERLGLLKIWNLLLCVGTYLLTVFGTFLTRSGVVQSVHAFAETDIGAIFLIYIFLIMSVTFALIFWRRAKLTSKQRIESYFSREAAFLFNNLIFISICFATFWGVMFPVFSDAFFGEKSVVGAPFFNRVNTPLFLLLLFFMGVGPLIAWKKNSLKMCLKLFLKPVLIGSTISGLFYFLDQSRPYSAASFGLSTFVLVTIFAEFHRGVKIRKQLTKGEPLVVSTAKLFLYKPRRYGGFIIHLGVVIMTIAITASMGYKIERELVLEIGEETVVGNYSIKLEELRTRPGKNFSSLIATLLILDSKSKNIIKLMHPERRMYLRNKESTSEVDIRITLKEDLYIALSGLAENVLEIPENGVIPQGSAVLKVFINPLQIWLWVGGIVVLFGTVLIIFSTARVSTLPANLQSAGGKS